jgi:fluoride ion exporter CrcB/FEX
MAPHTTLTPRQLVAAIVVVAAGGALGTLLRDLALRVDDSHWYRSVVGTSGWASHVPWVLGLINVVGVFFAAAALRGPLAHHDPNNVSRLIIITGFFGGFTSYSSLFVSLGAIWHVSVPGALLTAVSAVLSGVGAAWLGTRRRWWTR